MDHIAPRERDFEVDLESGGRVVEEDSSRSPITGVEKQAKVLLPMVFGGLVDGLNKGESRVSLCCDVPKSNGVPTDDFNSVTNKKVEREKIKDVVQKSAGKEKHKKSSNKKHPKPPRPPRGPSLDAADQKLIREIAELAMLKRARIERMRALKKMKAAKASSSSGNLFAILFTVLFCLVIIFQGMSSREAPGSLQGSPVSAGRIEDSLVSVQYLGSPPTSGPNGSGSSNSKLMEPVSGFDSQEKLRRVAG